MLSHAYMVLDPWVPKLPDRFTARPIYIFNRQIHPHRTVYSALQESILFLQSTGLQHGRYLDRVIPQSKGLDVMKKKQRIAG